MQEHNIKQGSRDYLLLQNEHLKTAVNEISKKIEGSLALKSHKHHSITYELEVAKNQNMQGKNNLKVEKQEELNRIINKITFYKEAIQKIKSQMDNVYNVNK